MKSVLREIKLQGSFNFRDLGGYPTEDGRRVKWGKLYRSGNLSILTDNDRTEMSKLGISKICDLRGKYEVNRFPDPEIQGIKWHHTPLLADDKVMGKVDGHFDFVERLRNSKPGELLLTLNKEMVMYKSALQRVFHVMLSEPETPMLFHCMAGKDRTGAVAALILSVLGVPRDVIKEDYLYTNETLEQMATNFNAIGYNDLPDVDQAVLDSLFEARVEYIDAFMNELEIRYGKIDLYTKEVLGLSDNDIQVLKHCFVE